MATSVHRDAESPAGQNRRIALALLVSLVVHVQIFLSPVWRIGSPGEATSPVLQVRIEPQDGKQAVDTPRDDAQSDGKILAAPAPVSGDVFETIDKLEPSDAHEPIDVPEPRDELEAGDTTEPRGLTLEDVNELIAVIGGSLDAPDFPSPSEAAGDDLRLAEPELADEPAPPADDVVATVAPADEAVLTRRLVREAQKLLDSGAVQRRLAFEGDDREYRAVFTRQPAADGTGIERMTVEISTELGGERVQTSLQMKRLAFSHFTQLVDRWDPEVLLHDDEIVGRFHSNSPIPLTYDRQVAPRLLGKVTTTQGIRIADQKGWRRNRDIFAGGLETRAPRIRLPEIALPVAHEYATGNADVQFVRNDALIVFHADGSYDCIELASLAEARQRLASDRPTYILGVRDAELHVRGVINGNVTVYSPRRIVVQGDLTYAHQRATGGASDAYLGLVSDGNVEVDRAEMTGPGDLEIHAAVYARKRFVVRGVRSRDGATLIIYGSLTAGSLSETEPRYATRIEFDPRFERTRPPGFPETDRYEIETWDGRWQVAGK